MTAPPVVVEELGKRYGDVVALEAVSLEVAPAELFGLVGPDGGGKTTLFRILATLIQADTGRAMVLGHDAATSLWDIRSRIGYMPGRFSLYPDLTVEENLRFFAAVFGTTVSAGYATIEPIYRQIEPFRTRRAGQLSGGMKQKLALCCALVHHPELLLLDEPTTGVDAVSRREFWDLLQGLKDGGLTIVISTPYMDEAERCDRVALVQAGRILAIDAPGRLGGRIPEPLLAIRGEPRYPLLRALRRFPHALSVLPFGAELHLRDSRREVGVERVRRDVEEFLLSEGFEAEVVAIEPGVEDAFIGLMGAAEVPAA